MVEKLKVGIIGVGNIANSHIESYRLLEDVEIVAFCDLNQEQLDYMQKKHQVSKGYLSVEEMLANEELDLVSVCTWNVAHAKCSIAALEHGVNVLCEKPMAMNEAEALEMKAAAEKNNRLLMVGLVKRFGNDLEILKDLSKKNYFGNIYYQKAQYLRRSGSPGGWFSDKSRSGGGPLIDLGVHIFDMMNYLYDNAEPVSVYGYTFNTIGNQPRLVKETAYLSAQQENQDRYDVEDFAGAVIRFDNNRIAVLETSYNLFLEKDRESLAIYGNQGGAEITDKLKLITNTCDYMTNSEMLLDTQFNFEKAFNKEVKHFVECVKNDCATIASADDGIRNMRVLDAIYESARTGKEVVL